MLRVLCITWLQSISRRQRPRLPLSPTELVPPNTLHTDRPHISGSTWVQAAPACSGVVSPYTVIVRYANWRPRGWPCPAGVGGDPPSFPQCMHVPGAAAAACAAWGRSERARRRPHNRRASLPPPRPLTSSHPYPPSHVDQHTCQTTQRLLVASRASTPVHTSMSAEPERRGSSSQSAIAPRGIREIRASRRSEPREEGYSAHSIVACFTLGSRRRTCACNRKASRSTCRIP